jgi:single-stranded-DNA-specific exonuclease
MFYLLLALRAELRRRGRFSDTTQPKLNALLDLVALGTIADVVPLDRNNRIFVAAGLERIRNGLAAPGIAALFEVAGRSVRTARASDLGFAVGPRINAAGRLTDMTVGIECLSTDDPARAAELARQLDDLNRERRVIEADMQLDALAELDDAELARRRTITLFNEGWHQGVVGLVASRVKERHHRPTIAFALADERNLRGSGRSIDGVHLRDVLDLVTKAAPGMIDKFGGHAMAAGLTLAAERYESFGRAFEAATQACTDAGLFTRRVASDGPLLAAEINLPLTEAIDRQIWGQGFAPPLFDNEFAVVEQRLVKEAHLKLLLELDGTRFDAIWFRRTQPLPTRVRLAYRPVEQVYRGQRGVSLHVEHAASV